jgi:uncharacterized membrane protein (UPF0127 family)
MNLPRMQLTAGEHTLLVYVARSAEERAVGLQHRRELPAHEGMLFICDRREVLSFWMKDTPLPLSIAFLHEDGTVLKIADLEPHDLEGESSEHPVRFVLEVNQGWFEERELGPGARFDGAVFLASREQELSPQRG